MTWGFKYALLILPAIIQSILVFNSETESSRSEILPKQDSLGASWTPMIASIYNDFIIHLRNKNQVIVSINIKLTFSIESIWNI